MNCEGCRRNAKNPRHTLRFWSLYDPDGPEYEGRWMHVDPSGATYFCTTPTPDHYHCEHCDAELAPDGSCPNELDCHACCTLHHEDEDCLNDVEDESA